MHKLAVSLGGWHSRCSESWSRRRYSKSGGAKPTNKRRHSTSPGVSEAFSQGTGHTHVAASASTGSTTSTRTTAATSSSPLLLSARPPLLPLTFHSVMASVNEIPQELLDHIIDFVDEPNTTSLISHLWLSRSKYRQFQTIQLTSPSRCHSLRKILVFSSPSHLAGLVRSLHVSGHSVDVFRWQVHDSSGLVFAAGAACSRMANLRSLKLTSISLDLDQQATFILSLIEPFRLLSSISFDHCTLSASLLPHILSLCSNLKRLSFCLCHDSVINWMTPPAEMTVAADSPPKLEYIDCDDQAPIAALSLATKISFASPLSLRICIRRTSPRDGFVSSMMVATKDALGELEIISDTTEPHGTEDSRSHFRLYLCLDELF